MSDDLTSEKQRQESMPFSRSGYYRRYNALLGEFQASSCLDFAVGTSLLDMPCGDGVVTALLAPRFERVVGVDASSVHVADARRRVPTAELHESLIEDFTTAERFSTITMLNVLEHVIDPSRVLAHAASLLDDDGVVIVHVPNAEALNRRIAVEMGTLTELGELSPYDVDVAGHRRYYDLDSLVDDVLAAGLTVAATGGIFLKMLSTPQFDWLLEQGLWAGNEFGWGRVGGPRRDWRQEFARACYEVGKERPRDCNIVYAVARRTP